MTANRFESAARALLVLALATPLVVIPWVLFPFVFAKAIFFQTLTALSAGLALGAKRGWIRRLPRDPLVLAAAVFLLSAILSAALGVDPRRSFLGSEERSAGVLFVAHAAAYFLLARFLFRRPEHWRNAGRAAAVFSGLLAAVAILQVVVFERSGIRLWRIDAGGRAAGFLGNPVYLGVFAPLALVWAAFGIKRETVPWKIISAISFAALLVADYLTLSRGAHLALIAAAVVGLLAAGAFTRGRAIRAAAVIAVLAALCAGGALFALRGNPAVARLPVVGPIVSSSFQSGTLGTRTMAWQVAVNAWRDHPLLGWGPDAFHLAFNAHYNPRFLEFSYYETWFDRAHNAFFDILVMQGAVGILALGAVALIVGLAIRRARGRGRFDAADAGIMAGGLAGYAVAEMAAFDNPATMAYLALLLAYLSWAAWGEEMENKKWKMEKDARISLRKLMVITLPIIAIIAVFDFIPALASAKTREMAERFVLRDDAAGIRIFRELLGWRMLYPEEPRIDGVSMLVRAMAEPGFTKERFDAEFPLVIRAMDDLVRLHPNQAYYWYLRGRALSQASKFDSSYLDEAGSNLARADELSPNRQQILYAIGKHLLFRKEPERALSVMERMVALDPQVAQSHWYYGAALVETGDELRGEAEIVLAGELGYDPQTLDEALLLRELFLRRADASRVAEYAQKVADIEPTAARYAEAAAAFGAIGENDQARKNVRKAVELDPSFAEEAGKFLLLLESGALLSPAPAL